MAEGEKVGAVYVSVGVDLDEANEAITAFENRLDALERRAVKIKVSGSQQGPETDPTSPPPPRHVTGTQAPSGSGSGSDATHQARIEANVTGLRAKIENELKAPFKITLEIANLDQIKQQIADLGGSVPINVQAQAAAGGGTAAGGGGTAAPRSGTLDAKLNRAITQMADNSKTPQAGFISNLQAVAKAAGKTVPFSTQYGEEPSAKQVNDFMHRWMQQMGVAGMQAPAAAQHVRSQLTGVARGAETSLLQGIGLIPKGTERDGVITTQPRYEGIFGATRYAEPVKTAAPPPVTPASPPPPPPAAEPAVGSAEARRKNVEQRRAAREAGAQRMGRYEGPTESFQAGRGTGMLADPIQIGSPRDSRGARQAPRINIGGTWHTAVQQDDGSWTYPKATLKKLRAAQAEGTPTYSEMGHARHGMYYDPDTKKLVMSAQGGSEGSARITGTGVEDPSAEWRNSLQIALHGGNIETPEMAIKRKAEGTEGNNLLGRLTASIIRGDADDPGVVMGEGGRETDRLVKIPRFTQSTADELGVELFGQPILRKNQGRMQVMDPTTGEATEETVKKLGLRGWVQKQVLAELGPEAMEDPELMGEIYDLTAPGGHLHRAMQIRRAGRGISPASIMSPGGPGTPGPHYSAAEPAGSTGAGISPTRLAKEMADRTYGVVGDDGLFRSLADPELRETYKDLGGRITEIRPHPHAFGNVQTQPVFRPLDDTDPESMVELAGFMQTGPGFSQEAYRSIIEGQNLNSRMAALRRAYPDFFDENGNPNPDFITPQGMLVDSTTLPVGDMERVTAAEENYAERFGGSIGENQIWALTQQAIDAVQTGNIPATGAPREVGRFKKGQSFTHGLRGEGSGDAATGYFDYLVQDLLNQPDGIFDTLNPASRPQDIGGIIDWLEAQGPDGAAMASGIRSGLSILQSRREAIANDPSTHDSRAGTINTRQVNPKKVAADNSKRQGKTRTASGAPIRPNKDIRPVPEFLYNPYSGPMAEAQTELEARQAALTEAGQAGMVAETRGQGDIEHEVQYSPAQREYDQYVQELRARAQGRARDEALEARGLQPGMSDDQIRSALRDDDRFRTQVGTSMVRVFHEGANKYTRRPEPRYEFDEEGIDAEIAAINAAEGGVSFGHGAVRSGQMGKLRRLRGAVRTEEADRQAGVTAAAQRVDEQKAVVDRMGRIAHAAYGAADRYMVEKGPGYRPSTEELNERVLNDPIIQAQAIRANDPDLPQAVARSMAMQLDAAKGGMRMAFGDRGNVPGPDGQLAPPTRRLRFASEETSMGESRGVTIGGMYFDRTTSVRSPMTGDETIDRMAELTGMVMPGQLPEYREGAGTGSAAAAMGLSPEAATGTAQTAGQAVAQGVEGAAAIVAAGGTTSGAVPVFVTNWPSGGMGGGGGGRRRPPKDGTAPEPEPESDEHAQRAAAEEEAKKKELLSGLAHGLREKGMKDLREQPASPMTELEIEREKARDAERKEDVRERRMIERQGTKDQKEFGDRRAREAEYGADLINEELQKLHTDMGLEGEADIMSPMYGAAKRLAGPAIKDRRAAEREAAKKAEASAGPAQPTEDQREAERRIAKAQRERQKIQNERVRPLSRNELNQRLIDLEMDYEGNAAPPAVAGLPSRQYSRETYGVGADVSRVLQQVRGQVRTTRGRMPQRALSTSLVQMSQNMIGNVDEVQERITMIEQRYAALTQMERDRQRVGGAIREGTRERIARETELASNRRGYQEAEDRAVAAGLADDKPAMEEAATDMAKFGKGIKEGERGLVEWKKQQQTLVRDYKEISKTMKAFGKETVDLAKNLIGAKDIFRNLGAGFVGGIAGGFVTLGVGAVIKGISTIVPLMIPEIDKMLGGGLKSQMIQRQQSQAFIQGGLSGSALRGQYAAAGYDLEGLKAMETASTMQARAIAGAQLYEQRISMDANAEAIRKQQEEMGLPSDVAPALFAQSGGISISKEDIGTILPPVGLAMELLGIGRMEAFGTDSAAKLVGQEISRITPEQIPFDPLIAASRGPIAAIGDFVGGGHPTITNMNPDVMSMNRRLEGTGVQLDATKTLDGASKKLLESVQGTEDIVRALEDKGIGLSGLENVEQIYAMVEQLSKPERDFRAYSDITLNSASFNNQLWAVGQQQALQREALMVSQGMQGAMQRPVQFGVGIAYRQGGPGPSSDLNQASQQADEIVMKNTQAALERMRSIEGVSADTVDLFEELGMKTRDWQTELGEIQSTQALRGFNIQLTKANQSMADLRGLMGRQGGSEIGQLQRANVLLQRRQQILQFEMQQRKINFSVAMAGFQSIGLTGEERAANIRIAKKEAAYQQESLDINKQIFGNNVQLFDAQNMRNFRNLARDINHMIQTFDENARVAELNQAISKTIRAQNNLNQEIGLMYTQEMEIITLQNQIIKKMADDTDKKLTLTGKMERVSETIKRSVSKIATAIEEAEAVLAEHENNDQQTEGDQAGGGGPIHVTVNVAGHAVPVDQIASVIERKLGEQGELRGLNS